MSIYSGKDLIIKEKLFITMIYILMTIFSRFLGGLNVSL